MKPPVFLKGLLDTCFIFILITLIISIIASIWSAIGQESFIPFNINGEKIENFSFPALILVLLGILNSVLYIFIIYVLRKLVKSFFNDEMFTRFQISSLHLTGQLMILATMISPIFNLFGKIFFKSSVRIGLDVELSMNSFWFTLAIGLFFILMSKVFQNAKEIKDENDLTV